MARGRHSDRVPCAWAGHALPGPGFLLRWALPRPQLRTPVARAVEAGTTPPSPWFLLDVLRSCVDAADVPQAALRTCCSRGTAATPSCWAGGAS